MSDFPINPRESYDKERNPLHSLNHSNLFIGQRELQFFESIGTEMIEHMEGQVVLYYEVDVLKTKINPVYEESKKKVIKKITEIYARVESIEPEIVNNRFTADRTQNIVVHFQRTRSYENLGFKPRNGDYVGFDGKVYEIYSVTDDDPTYGKPELKINITVKGVLTRESDIEINKRTIYENKVQYNQTPGFSGQIIIPTPGGISGISGLPGSGGGGGGDSGTSGISGNGGSGISGNASSGISGNASSGISGNSSSGISGNASSGISGNSSSGISGNSSSGISGNAQSGISGNSSSGISGNSSSGISGALGGNGNDGTSGISGNASSGISGNASSGISGNSSSGISGNAQSGTSGISGNAQSGISGTAAGISYPVTIGTVSATTAQTNFVTSNINGSTWGDGETINVKVYNDYLFSGNDGTEALEIVAWYGSSSAVLINSSGGVSVTGNDVFEFELTRFGNNVLVNNSNFYNERFFNRTSYYKWFTLSFGNSLSGYASNTVWQNESFTADKNFRLTFQSTTALNVGSYFRALAASVSKIGSYTVTASTISGISGLPGSGSGSSESGISGISGGGGTGNLSGTGTPNFLSKWTSATGLADSIISHSGNTLSFSGKAQAILSTGLLTPKLSFTSVSTSYTASVNDCFIGIISSAGAINLLLQPASSIPNGYLIIKDIFGSASSNFITILRQGTDLIDNASSFIIDSSLGSIGLMNDGISKYYII